MPALRPRRSLPQQRNDTSDEDTDAPPHNSSDEDSSSDDELGQNQSEWKTPRGKQNLKSKRKAEPQSTPGVKQEPKPKMREFDEEALNAPPITTSDEEGDLSDGEQSDGLGFEVTPRRAPVQTQTLDQKLKGESPSLKGFNSPSSARKRTSQEMQESGDPREALFGMWSQRGYANKRHSYSKFRKTPSSSFAESHLPSSAPLPKSSVTSFEDQAESSEEERKAFRFPRNFDAKEATASPRDEIPDSDDDSSPLSSPISYGSASDVPLKDDDDESKEAENQTSAEFNCPICKEPVEPGLLVMFRAQPRQRIRDQMAFCESHKISNVDEQWKEKGYPTIMWEKFDERIESHFNELEKLLVPESSSYYRNVLDTNLKSGKARNFRLTLAGDDLETISCGYYGTRGSGKMLESITHRFARKLRRLATEDHIVKQAGVVAYAQAVLVPELAIILIKEDMGVDDDDARQIMRESIGLGQKINPAENDVVPIVDEEDEALSRNHESEVLN